jgi:hypothetical protein
MSTIIASNVSDGTLSIPTTYVTNGSAKAWVNFDGTGTIAARDSLNVSSLTDIGTGRYDVNLTSVFASTGYVCVGSAVSFALGNALTTQLSAGVLAVQVFDNSSVLSDSGIVQSGAYGDLA